MEGPSAITAALEARSSEAARAVGKSNHREYAKQCSKRIGALRRQLGVTQRKNGRGAFAKKLIPKDTPERQTALVALAEREWAAATAAAATLDEEPFRRRWIVRRLRRTLQHAQQLQEAVAAVAPAASAAVLEAAAYAAVLEGELASALRAHKWAVVAFVRAGALAQRTVALAPAGSAARAQAYALGALAQARGKFAAYQIGRSDAALAAQAAELSPQRIQELDQLLGESAQDGESPLDITAQKLLAVAAGVSSSSAEKGERAAQVVTFRGREASMSTPRLVGLFKTYASLEMDVQEGLVEFHTDRSSRAAAESLRSDLQQLLVAAGQLRAATGAAVAPAMQAAAASGTAAARSDLENAQWCHAFASNAAHVARVHLLELEVAAPEQAPGKAPVGRRDPRRLARVYERLARETAAARRTGGPLRGEFGLQALLEIRANIYRALRTLAVARVHAAEGRGREAAALVRLVAEPQYAAPARQALQNLERKRNLLEAPEDRRMLEELGAGLLRLSRAFGATEQLIAQTSSRARPAVKRVVASVAELESAPWLHQGSRKSPGVSLSESVVIPAAVRLGGTSEISGPTPGVEESTTAAAGRGGWLRSFFN